jgi:two-component system chemotaxis response regulator CheY
MALESVSALILDDNAHMRGLVRVILTSFGMRRIEEAADGNEAIAHVAGGDIDIAFVDFKLGGLDGLDFCRRIRLDRESPDRYLPIVMITAYSERSRVIDAINAGGGRIPCEAHPGRGRRQPRECGDRAAPALRADARLFRSRPPSAR